MRWRLFIVITLGVLIVVLGISAFALKSSEKSTEIISPLGKSQNIFSFFKKPAAKPKIIIYGYLPYWVIDHLDYIQLDKVTDIAYFGLYLNADGSFVTKTEDGFAEPGFLAWHENEKLKKFINTAKELGTRISLTLISHDDKVSDKILTCKECWPVLLENLEKEMDIHEVKDVNLNFEYVEFTDDKMGDLYTELASYLNTELDKKYGNSFVTVATFADSFVKPRVTKIEPLSKVVDAMFIMAYDFHQPTSDNAGPVAPVNGKGVHSEYDIVTMLGDYLRVVPPSKILLGVPYYGYNWVVEDDSQLSKRVEGSDARGFSQSQAYSDIMDSIQELKPEIKWDDIAKVPYFNYVSPETLSKRQVYFENEQSLEIKYDLVKTNKLAGIGIWALGYDGGYQELWNLLDKKFLN